MENNELFEEIKEEQESYSDSSLYNINSFGNDLILKQVIDMYRDGDIEKPELQRKYVWTRDEASRFIDSVLLGLPVPSVFLAKDKDNKLLIVDGYQRIMTVYDFFMGSFSGDGKPFKLSESERIYKDWRGKSYQELSDQQKRFFRMYTIHAIVFEQKQPADDSAMYQIFERLNTGGKVLRPQEIRNCVYHGPFNTMLVELNIEPVWRKVLGFSQEDQRMADMELILRFFAFRDFETRSEKNLSQINLVNYLNEYMGKNRCIDSSSITNNKQVFITVLSFLLSSIGEHVFRTCKTREDGSVVWAKKINPVIFDAVCTATMKWNLSNCVLSADYTLEEKYKKLVLDKEFAEVISQRTTNVENINKRVSIAAKVLYGIE